MAGSTYDTIVDFSPLSQACIKALTDKMEDKRKFAASEIEKMTVEFGMTNNLTMINRLVIVLGRKFCLSPTPNSRKGGLLGLAAVMVGFKSGSMVEPPPETVEEVVRPILTCFLDADPRVRYYACESLYNVTKVARSNILPLFDSIFDNMAKIVADPEIGVRTGAEILDRLLKDILVEQSNFDVENFAPKLEEYIYTKNPFTRMFIISWIRLLDSKFDIIYHLPSLLDGIFNCLYDSTDEIRASTLNLLSEFLNKIVACPTDKINMPSLVHTLVKHAKNEREDVVQYTAIAWLRQFIGLMDDQEIINFTSIILAATLPCLAYQSSPDDSVASSRDRQSIYPSLQRFIPQSPSRGNICEIASLVNSMLLEQLTTVLVARRNTLGTESVSSDLEPVIDVLIRELQKQEHPVIKLAILDWLKKIKKAEPEFTLTSMSQQKLFQILLEILSDRSDAVVKNSLRVIADIFCFDRGEEQQQVPVSSPEDDFSANKDDESSDIERRKPLSKQQATQLKGTPGSSSKKVAIATCDASTIHQSNANMDRSNILIKALFKTFRDKEDVFEDRGTFIILNLCGIVKPEIVYNAFAEIIKDEKLDLKFVYKIVQKLNQILLTTQPLFGLRSRLGNDDDPEMIALFHSLYYAWCHSPIAALTLCLLTNNYRHANEIVTALSQTDMSVDMLTQIDWTVQLIESPVFSSLRMRLLDTNNNQYLLQSLYGLLMILPQSEAYRKLGHRLDQVYKFMSILPHSKTVGPASHVVHKPSQTGSKDLKKTSSSTNLETLMRHYFTIQNQTRETMHHQ